MTDILISVRDVHEAQTILKAVPDLAILDIKEPRQGAMGAATPQQWQAVHNLPLGTTAMSVALGELEDLDLSVIHRIPHGTRYAKVGLANQVNSNWLDDWNYVQENLPRGTELVGVIYADDQQARSPTVQQILDSLLARPCLTFLIDTFNKSCGHLLNHLPPHALTAVVKQIHQHQGKLVLAGSITTDLLPDIMPVVPDCIGVRGAVCDADRASTVCPLTAAAFASSLTFFNAGI
ncbi:MAG: (5-formylfuran-3-yl)methyl phosphate synthase [Planctomycetota bacterium]|nr:(5-formylfuran-3-yl)methyl phosphate synthase [Planctomycetota bacterium]